MTLEWLFVACWGIVIWSNYVIIVERTCTSESMNPRPCFLSLQYRLRSFLSLATLLFLLFQITKTYIYHPYCNHHLFVELVHLYNYHCIGCVGDTRDFLLFGCRVSWERPSSYYTSYGLINLRSSTWGKFATVLQTCALAGPTTCTRRRLCSRHHPWTSLLWRYVRHVGRLRHCKAGSSSWVLQSNLLNKRTIPDSV